MPSFLRHFLFPHESNNQRAKLLHPSSWGLIIGLFTVFQLTINQLTISYPQILGYASQIAPETIIKLTNLKRQENGLLPLQSNPELSAAAAQKAADMFARNYWAHVSPVGTQPWYFITTAGYTYRYAGENLARDFSQAQAVVEAWMASPSHRDNLLNSHYQDIGIAVVDGTLDGRETTLVVQLLGTKLSAAPSLTQGAVTIVKPVQAASAPSTMNYEPLSKNPKISPFDITKLVSLALIVIFIAVLTIDVISAYRSKIVRWTSKSLAHLLFLLALLIAALIISKGQII